MCGVARAVVGQPFDDRWQSVDWSEAMLDRCDHEVANVLAFNALGGGDKAHSFPIAAVEREGHPDLLPVIAGELEAIGAPAQVGAINGNPTIVTAVFNAASVPL